MWSRNISKVKLRAVVCSMVVEIEFSSPACMFQCNQNLILQIFFWLKLLNKFSLVLYLDYHSNLTIHFMQCGEGGEWNFIWVTVGYPTILPLYTVERWAAATADQKSNAPLNMCLPEHFNTGQECTFELNLGFFPTPALYFTSENHPEACKEVSFQRKLNWKIHYRSELSVLQLPVNPTGQTRLDQIYSGMKSQTGSVDFESSTSTVSLDSFAPITPQHLLIRMQPEPKISLSF